MMTVGHTIKTASVKMLSALKDIRKARYPVVSDHVTPTSNWKGTHDIQTSIATLLPYSRRVTLKGNC